MSFVLKPTLRQLAEVKLATILWNQPDVKADISKFYESLNDTEDIENTWSEIEDKVKKKVPSFSVPECLKTELLTLIKPVGFQILRWLQYHGKFDISLPQEFFWKPYGTIDRKRTAEMYVKDESIDIIIRYKLSCTYCFEESILELWSKMKKSKNSFVDNPNQTELIALWSYIMRSGINALIIRGMAIEGLDGGENVMRSPYRYPLQSAAYFGNAVATEYFYYRMAPNERREPLVPLARMAANNYTLHPEYIKEYYSETLCFLLSKMDSLQKRELFSKATLQSLVCLLEWPWHVFYVEALNAADYFLSLKMYVVLFDEILDKAMNGHKYLNYQEMNEENWQQSADDFKKFVVQNCFHPRFDIIVKLFKLRDERNIKSILSYATLKEKKLIIYSCNGRDIFNDLIDAEKWGLIDYFIRECIQSRNEMIKFKKHVEEIIIGSWPKDVIIRSTHKLYKFFQLLDDILCGFNKRICVEENDIDPAKKVCISDIKEEVPEIQDSV